MIFLYVKDENRLINTAQIIDIIREGTNITIRLSNGDRVVRGFNTFDEAQKMDARINTIIRRNGEIEEI